MHNILVVSNEVDIGNKCKDALLAADIYHVVTMPANEKAQSIRLSERLDCIIHVWEKVTDEATVTFLRALKISYPSVPVLVVLPRRDDNAAMCALGGGACGSIVAVDMTDFELLERVRTAISITNDSYLLQDNTTSLILVVDDNQDDREVVARMLKKSVVASYECAEAESLESMLDVMARRHPDCVLLDYSMPGMNGLDILRTIMPRYPFLPVIMMTGQGSEVVAAESIKSGAQSYLVKSRINSDMLFTTIRAAIKQRGLERERSELVQKLLDSNTALERFAYVASHDLQEPIRMIYSFGRILLDDCYDKLDDTSREYLLMITESGERMRDVVSDLLDYSRITNQTFERVAFDGEFAMSGALENLKSLITETGAIINRDDMPELYGNPVQVMRLFQNIICNAIKYQQKGNTPKIDIQLHDMSTHWKISITDNGIGIDKRFIQDVFSPFRRLHTWDEVKGSGLGLAICRKIAESNNGSIDVSSTLGKGSTFMIRLPKSNIRFKEAVVA